MHLVYPDDGADALSMVPPPVVRLGALPGSLKARAHHGVAPFPASGLHRFRDVRRRHDPVALGAEGPGHQEEPTPEDGQSW